MKKLLAVLLAMALALTGAASLAEEIAAGGDPAAEQAGEVAEASAEFSALTLESELDVNRTALKLALAKLGVDEAARDEADKVAALLDAVSERAIWADGGLQYELYLADECLLTAAGILGDDGLLLGSTLLPSYALSLSADSLGGLRAAAGGLEGVDRTALVQAMAGPVQEYVGGCISAISFGQSQLGSYERGELSFNVMVPVNVDMAAVRAAAVGLVNALAADANVQAALEALRREGVAVSLESVALPEDGEEAEPLPELDVAVYMTVDAQGQTGEVIDVAFDLTLPGGEVPFASGDVLSRAGGVTVSASVPDANADAVVTYLPDDAGFSARLDAYLGELYGGVTLVCDTQPPYAAQLELYLVGDKTPVLTERASLALEGARDYDPAAGKTVVALEDLSGENGPELLGRLGMDLLFLGAGRLAAAATQAMPEEARAVLRG